MKSRRFAPFVGCAALLVLAGCSSTVTGQGGVTGSAPSGSASHDFPSGSPASPSPSLSPASSGSSGAPSPTATSVPTRFARTPASTAIGDPPTVDLCSAIQVSAFAQPGFAPSLADIQFPGGCNLRLTRSDGSHVTVTVYATDRPNTTTTGRTVKRLSGLPVLVFPFQPSLGECERDIVASGVALIVTSLTYKGTTTTAPNRTVNCTATDLLAAKMAAAVTGHTFRPLQVASPSLTALNACQVAGAAGWPSQPPFSGATPKPDEFGVGCNFTVGQGYIYVDPEIAKAATVTDAKPVSVGGHTLYAASVNDATNCTFTSVQGSTPDGRTERLYLSGYTSTKSTTFCSQLSAAFARYLTVAGLR